MKGEQTWMVHQPSPHLFGVLSSEHHILLYPTILPRQKVHAWPIMHTTKKKENTAG